MCGGAAVEKKKKHDDDDDDIVKPPSAARPTVGHQLKRGAEAGRSFGGGRFRSALSSSHLLLFLCLGRPTDRPYSLGPNNGIFFFFSVSSFRQCWKSVK